MNEHSEVRAVPLDDGEITFSQSDLESQALRFLRQNKKKEIKGMSKAEVNEWATLKANAARRLVENLMATGEPSFVAWPRAIRSEILESESD